MGKVVILGLGKTGLSCVNYFLRKGITPTVLDTRQHPPGMDELPVGVELLTGSWDESRLLCAELIVSSPGIALSTPALQKAQQAGVEVIGDIELFVREAKAPIVAITGSNGKSTVTTLVGEMAVEAGISVGVGGNIGTPALDLLLEPAALYVLELSSFQLETTHSLRAAAATILNLSEDHMDRYDGMDGYLAAKRRIYDGAERIVCNRDDKATLPVTGKAWQSFGLDGDSYGRVSKDGALFLAVNGESVLASDALHIVGAHNQMNALAAMALSDAVGIPRTAQLAVLRRFTGLPHRCQFVREHDGIRWINDSKATNVGSTLAAVAGIAESIKGKLILIAGGQGKGQDFSPLQALLGHSIQHMICFGQDASILAALGSQAEIVADLPAAVARAKQLATQGDWVLLAPACASLDMFKNFEARGDQFAKLVGAL